MSTIDILVPPGEQRGEFRDWEAVLLWYAAWHELTQKYRFIGTSSGLVSAHVLRHLPNRGHLQRINKLGSSEGVKRSLVVMQKTHFVELAELLGILGIEAETYILGFEGRPTTIAESEGPILEETCVFPRGEVSGTLTIENERPHLVIVRGAELVGQERERVQGIIDPLPKVPLAQNLTWALGRIRATN